jgi:hypothetical protein
MWLNAQPAYRCQGNCAPFKIKGLWFHRNRGRAVRLMAANWKRRFDEPIEKDIWR